MIKTRNRGFTLVELLVVIAIIAVLVATTSVMFPKIKRKGLQAKCATTMRQMTTLMNTYAIDHSNKLPAPATPASQSDSGRETYWFTVCQQQITGEDMDRYLEDRWWKENPSIFINPMFAKKKIRANSVGYAMNGMIAANIAATRGESLGFEESKYTAVNVASVRKPELTPVVMPHWDWAYSCDRGEAGDKRFDEFLVNERLPVLFLDGHTETITTKEYTNRDLYMMPKPE